MVRLEILQAFKQFAQKCSAKGIQIDSRKIETGDLFFAFPGHDGDGREYIQQAIDAGCSGVVCEENDCKRFGFLSSQLTTPCLKILNLSEKISQLAKAFYQNPAQDMCLIGVTGTNGKTSVASYIAQLNSQAQMIGTLGWGRADQLTPFGLTTPDAVTVQKIFLKMREQNCQMVAMEVSAHALVQSRVAAVDFNTAVFTHFSQDHLDYFQSMEQYFAAKCRLFTMPSIKRAVVCVDDEHAADLISLCHEHHKRVITYGVSDKADFRLRVVASNLLGSTGVIHSPWGEYDFKAQLFGVYNLLNLLAAAIAASQNQHEFKALLARMQGVVAPVGRMQLAAKSPTILVDYAHTPVALEQVLLAARAQMHAEQKLWCVFGCGGDRDQKKRPLMGKAAKQYADYCVLTNDNPRSECAQDIVNHILEGMGSCREQIFVELDRAQAIAFAIEKANKTDVIVIAGKGHEDYQIIGDTKHSFSDASTVRNCLNAQEQVV